MGATYGVVWVALGWGARGAPALFGLWWAHCPTEEVSIMACSNLEVVILQSLHMIRLQFPFFGSGSPVRRIQAVPRVVPALHARGANSCHFWCAVVTFEAASKLAPSRELHPDACMWWGPTLYLFCPDRPGHGMTLPMVPRSHLGSGRKRPYFISADLT